MGKIIELRPADHYRVPEHTAPPGVSDVARYDGSYDGAYDASPVANPVMQATDRLIRAFSDLIAALEASHRRIRMLIDTVPDVETKARLSRDLATLTVALKDAKGKAVAVGLMRSGG